MVPDRHDGGGVGEGRAARVSSDCFAHTTMIHDDLATRSPQLWSHPVGSRLLKDHTGLEAF